MDRSVESPLKRAAIVVKATWDDEAEVWTASSSDVQGLATEAETLEKLREKILVMIPELLELKDVHVELAEIPVYIMAEQATRVANPFFH